jgi:predicted dehydrogenase
MSSLADLHRAVEAALASKRLGQPVFVRYLWHGFDKPNEVAPRLAVLVDTVRRWLGQTPERIYATGGLTTGQVSLTLEFREGGTAMVGWTSSRDRGNGVDLMILGNRGAMYHDAGSAELLDEQLTPAAGPALGELQTVIEQALRSGKPEAVGRAQP